MVRFLLGVALLTHTSAFAEVRFQDLSPETYLSLRQRLQERILETYLETATYFSSPEFLQLRRPVNLADWSHRWELSRGKILEILSEQPELVGTSKEELRKIQYVLEWVREGFATSPFFTGTEPQRTELLYIADNSRQLHTLLRAANGKSDSPLLPILRAIYVLPKSNSPRDAADLVWQSVEFFNRYAWDLRTRSYATGVAVDGTITDTNRHLIATSRMGYGLSRASVYHPELRAVAQHVIDFIEKYMVRTEITGTWNRGPYFLAKVEIGGGGYANGVHNDKLVVNEQAYGLNGMVALYRTTKDISLMQRIRTAYDSFNFRFHDPKTGGYFDEYSLADQSRTPTKSYNSTVYPATAFLLDLYDADPVHRPAHTKSLLELGDAVVSHLHDPQTGWIVENFDAEWKAEWRAWQKQETGTVGVVGHNFQAAWFLLRMVENGLAKNERAEKYRKVAKEILESMLSRGAVDWVNGGVYDCFVRETSQIVKWDGKNESRNKAWWQQEQAVLSLMLAAKLGVLDTEESQRARDLTLKFYFKHFLDRTHGGEFNVVSETGEPVSDALKGGPGKSTYHAVEFVEKLEEYGGAGFCKGVLGNL